MTESDAAAAGVRRWELCGQRDGACRGGGGACCGGGGQPDDNFPLPSLNAIYVLPSARRSGACARRRRR